MEKDKDKDVQEKIKILVSYGFEKLEGYDTLYHKDGMIVSTKSQHTASTLKSALEDFFQREGKASPSKGDAPQDEGEEDVFAAHSEEVAPVFSAGELDAVPVPVFYRLTLDGNRYYYRAGDDGGVKIYASGTTLIKDGYADDKTALQEWKSQLKYLGQDPEAVSAYEADKGTIMHYLYGLYLMGKDIVLLRSFIIKEVKRAKLNIPKKNIEKFCSSEDDIDNMIQRLVRFAKFCADYKVRPLLIEKVLSLEEYCVASPVDLVCEMTEARTVEGYFGAVYQKDTKEHRKGDPKLEKKKVEEKYFAIVDFKSGGIWPQHALQLELYRRMVGAWYGDALPIRKIYNFSPKSDSSRGYTLRDQTGNREIRKADAVFAQGMLNHLSKDKTYKAYRGKLNIKDGFDEGGILKTYDIAEELARLLQTRG